MVLTTSNEAPLQNADARPVRAIIVAQQEEIDPMRAYGHSLTARLAGSIALRPHARCEAGSVVALFDNSASVRNNPPNGPKGRLKPSQ